MGRAGKNPRLRSVSTSQRVTLRVATGSFSRACQEALCRVRVPETRCENGIFVLRFRKSAPRSQRKIFPRSAQARAKVQELPFPRITFPWQVAPAPGTDVCPYPWGDAFGPCVRAWVGFGETPGIARHSKARGTRPRGHLAILCVRPEGRRAWARPSRGGAGG